MTSLTFFPTLSFLSFLVLSLSCLTSAHTHEDFLQCLGSKNSISKLIYTPINSSYSSILQFSIQNLRFNTSSTPKPLVIVTPISISHVQAAVTCSQKHGMQIRIRSGGHDYEGLSYVSTFPFVVVDLINLRAINVDATTKTAWVQSGATIGEVYYRIAEKSRTLAFPASVCPTVGVGGHFSGGGWHVMRKYGLAADNIIDASLVDAEGRILDRESMGEDLFWAIRGGGGNTFGVVIAWKISLVPVPPTVTVFNVQRTLEQNASKLVHRWQFVADKLHEDLFIRVILSSSIDARKLPGARLVKEDCTEMSWIQSVLYFDGLPSNSSLDVLLDRTPSTRRISKRNQTTSRNLYLNMDWRGYGRGSSTNTSARRF
uniref:FAD-binding PCMH-type domain-containing protein n=1 Tax=Salix viminalis TaxID=40686 RepID=A0A6N2K9P6_SALVM